MSKIEQQINRLRSLSVSIKEQNINILLLREELRDAANTIEQLYDENKDRSLHRAEYLQITKEPNDRNKINIWEMLKEADTEFIPPLSSRYKTTQNDFIHDIPGSLMEYYESLLDQTFIFHCRGKEIAGFISFKPDYHLINPHGLDIKCHYISTIIVKGEYRNTGIAKKMYDFLLSSSDMPIATRTWSSNTEHIGLLNKLGFKEELRIKNDRGEGIDTIYFVKHSSNRI